MCYNDIYHKKINFCIFISYKMLKRNIMKRKKSIIVVNWYYDHNDQTMQEFGVLIFGVKWPMDIGRGKDDRPEEEEADGQNKPSLFWRYTTCH